MSLLLLKCDLLPKCSSGLQSKRSSCELAPPDILQATPPNGTTQDVNSWVPHFYAQSASPWADSERDCLWAKMSFSPLRMRWMVANGWHCGKDTFWLARGLEKVYLLLSFKLHRHWALTRPKDMGTPPQNMSAPQSPTVEAEGPQTQWEMNPVEQWVVFR